MATHQASNRSRLFTTALASAAMLGAMFSTPATASPDVVREGVGDRRAALDKLELTPFDQGLWSGLADWKNGGPLDAESTRGKVVVIYTFAGYLPTAVRPISIVNRLAERYGDEGLVVVGVHADEAYEDGVKTAERRRVTFPIARDTGGAMRSALKVDQDPDFYLIDRSGRLRYADVETASIEKAVSELIAESKDDAESLLDRRAATASKADADARRSARLRSQIDLDHLPWVPFTPPSPEAYANTDWPELDLGDNNSRRRSRNAPSGPVRLDLAIDQDWHPAPPQHTDGRAVLVYVFSENILEDFNKFGLTPIQLFSEMDRIQKEHARDLIVVGAMVPSNPPNARRGRRNNDGEEARKRLEDANKVFETVTKEMPVDHVRINDFAGSFVTGRFTPNNGELPGGRGRQQDGFVYPYHYIASSDGMVRWHGSIVTSPQRNAEWEAAFAKVLAVDPGIKARREAEQAYIRSKTE